MSVVQYKDQTLHLLEGESVLDGLLRHGFNIPHGCKSGVCHSCMLIADEDTDLPAASQLGIKSTQKAQGYFLSCSCVPQSNINVHNDPSCFKRTTAVIEKISLLNQNVYLLRLRAPDFNFIPGQYITLWRNERIARCYSIASASDQSGFIELHIKLVDKGLFSAWVFHNCAPGDSLDISGPNGDCFYTGENPEATLLLAGMSTGLAPLYGILKYALNAGHKGNIHLIAGAKHAQGLYLVEELRELESKNANLKVDFVVQSSGGKPGIIEDNFYEFVKEKHPSTKGMITYLCGGSNFVQKLKKQIFLAGANSKDIYADIFLPFNA